MSSQKKKNPNLFDFKRINLPQPVQNNFIRFQLKKGFSKGKGNNLQGINGLVRSSI